MIRIEHLNYEIDHEPILKDISFELKPHRTYGIIGPNGAGKSTLLKHMMRIIEPPKNTIFYGEKDITQFKIKDYAKQCSFVFQENSRDLEFTVEEMIQMGRYPYVDLLGRMSTEDEEIVEEILTNLKLDHLKKRSIKTLSGGEAQKVFIGRALAQQTSLLLLDEPISMLDIHNSIEILNRIEAIKRQYQLTVIIVLHDLNLAFQYCDHIILLNKGELLSFNAKEKVLHDERLQQVYHHKLKVIEDYPHTYIVPKSN